MNFVDRPTLRPQTCAVLQIGASHDDVWIDTGTNLQDIDPRVYISGRGGAAIARLLGWTSPEDRAALDEAVEGFEDRVADLEEQLAQADKELSAIDILASEGWQARKKTGRPRKETREEVADGSRS